MCQSVGAFQNGASYLGTSGLGSRIRWGGVALVLLTMAGFLPAAGARGDDRALGDDEALGGDEARGDDDPGAAEQIAAGQELFSREWKAGVLGWGDGLGPLYNAASCAQCHRLGGVGGAGANEHNVDLLTVKVPRNVVVAGGDLRQRVAAFHPALAAGQLSATTVLHRFSTNADYDAWRKRFLPADEQAQLSLARIVAVATAASKHPVKATNAVERLAGMAYQHSQRNTPALFGAGMIDRLPDSVFEELEQRQAATTGKMRGRVPRAANGKVGRFGWRGQTESLHEFVLGACAVELGLEAPGRPQPIDPLRVRFDDSGRAHSPGRGALDITDEQCQSLTGFVARLPPPQRMTPTDPAEAEMAARGEERFEKIGCADCHLPQVADVAGIFSDLLLHDLGEGLEDPVPANPAQGTAGSASYYGGADSLLVKASPEQRREWRTPPLWGVRDSAPYLHDGRAQTFAEAIAWHGGQAAPSARDFRRLQKDEREEVIAFLNCLTAPTPE